MAGEYMLHATVRVQRYYQVRIPYDAPHPDMGDFEAIALKLDKHIEENGGEFPADVEIDYTTINSETEPWLSAAVAPPSCDVPKET